MFRKQLPEEESFPPKKNSFLILVLTLLFLALTIFTIYILTLRLNSSPAAFPHNEPFVLPEGTHVREAAELLKKQGFVRSSAYTKFVLSTSHKEDFIRAGVYLFEKPLTTKEITLAITQGTYLSPTYKATFPEGFRTEFIATYLPKEFASIDREFLKMHEGYLFPDTYYFSDTTDIQGLVALMRENFEKKIAPLVASIDASGFSLEEVVILASLVEREANDPTSMRMVAGILRNRLEDDMPLQVDATFEYLLGKESKELTGEDLEIDSPYNTYLYRGLPPTPISNPGLTSILAVLDPIETDYLFYLTGNDGIFYYAETFEEHKENKERYLR